MKDQKVFFCYCFCTMLPAFNPMSLLPFKNYHLPVSLWKYFQAQFRKNNCYKLQNPSHYCWFKEEAKTAIPPLLVSTTRYLINNLWLLYTPFPSPPRWNCGFFREKKNFKNFPITLMYNFPSFPPSYSPPPPNIIYTLIFFISI